MANGVTRALDANTTYDGNYPTVASDSTSKFIPQIWSSKMLRNFYEMTAFLEIANTDYEGEIKNQGDMVIIRTTPDITITAYEVGRSLVYEVPEKANRSLNIDKAYSWSFRMDDIDEKQIDIPLIAEQSADAGEKLKIKIDQECFQYVVGKADSDNRGNTAGAISGNIALGAAGGTNGSLALAVTKALATDFIVDFNTVLDEANMPSENRWVVLPAWFCALLKKSDLKQADITGDSTGVLRTGVIGMVDRTKIIQSNNLYHITEGTAELFYCLAGTKEAITFALQLTKTETLPIQESFGTYMRGLSVYGREVVQPTALVEAVAIRG
jgi:hypothetical protein